MVNHFLAQANSGYLWCICQWPQETSLRNVWKPQFTWLWCEKNILFSQNQPLQSPIIVKFHIGVSGVLSWRAWRTSVQRCLPLTIHTCVHTQTTHHGYTRHIIQTLHHLPHIATHHNNTSPTTHTPCLTYCTHTYHTVATPHPTPQTCTWISLAAKE